MSGSEYKNIIPSLTLFEESKKLDISGACVSICTKALGGKVELSDITPLEDGNTFPADLRRFAPAKGIDIDTWYDIPEKVEQDLLRAYLSDRGQDEGKTNRNFVGHFFLYDFGNSEGAPPFGHCFAIPARNKLSRDLRKKLKSLDSWLVVDAMISSGYTTVTTKDLAEWLKEINEAGMEVMVAKAFLRK
jgi:hypothetical protein